MAIRVERKINGKTLAIEAGKMAKLTNGAAWVQYGETVVFCTATMDEARPGIDFFPLTVDYREKTAAAGKIPGGFFKREGRPTTKEILTMRMIDRPTRPLFPDGFKKEVQIQCMVLSADDDNEPDVLAMIGASAAIAISDIPWNGPTAAVRVGRAKNKFVVMPTFEQMESSDLNLIIAGTKNAITMVESGSNELSEAAYLDALETGQKAIGDIVDLVDELVEKIGKEKIEWTAPDEGEHFAPVNKWLQKGMKEALSTPAKKARTQALSDLKEAMLDKFLPDEEERAERKKEFGEYFYEVLHRTARAMIKAGKRMDGRDTDEIRPIASETSVLPRTHGSALFTRGETQALATVTLGTTADKQIIDGLRDEVKKGFMLHYAFPSFSVGECRPIRGPGRREIGHGALAERAIEAVLPDPTEFPYTVRITSDVLESNGSSSMATVCSGSLALMDAGVKIRRPVAGIAMGLIKEGKDFFVLSDILGDEDHHGDMDFKVAGTDKGITALQMDIKIDGVTREVLSQALAQAKDGRLHILKEMKKALGRPRTKLNKFAPRVAMLKINPEKIGVVIGPGGKTVRKIQEETGAKIEIVDEEGHVAIYGSTDEAMNGAKHHVEMLTAEAEVGKKYMGKVMSIKDFGAFIEVIPGQDGLLHISDMGNGFVDRVSDLYKPGDEVEVIVEDVNDFGKIRLVLADPDSVGSGSSVSSGKADDDDAKGKKGRGDKKDKKRDKKDRDDRDKKRGKKRDEEEEPVEEEEFDEEEEVFDEDVVEEDYDEEEDFDDELQADDAEEDEDFEDEEDVEEEEEEPEHAPSRGHRDGGRGRGGDRGGRGRGRGDDRGGRDDSRRGRGRDDNRDNDRGRGRGRDQARGRGRDDESRGRGRGGRDDDSRSRGRGGRDDDRGRGRGRGRDEERTESRGGRDDNRRGRGRDDNRGRDNDRGRGRGRDEERGGRDDSGRGRGRDDNRGRGRYEEREERTERGARSRDDNRGRDNDRGRGRGRDEDRGRGRDDNGDREGGRRRRRSRSR